MSELSPQTILENYSDCSLCLCELRYNDQANNSIMVLTNARNISEFLQKIKSKHLKRLAKTKKNRGTV